MVQEHKRRQHIVQGINWVNEVKLQSESEAVVSLMADVQPDSIALIDIQENAAALVEDFRSNPKLKSLLDAFLQEYGLSNSEGIGLMCLAEALLRVPDSETRDDLIADKIAPGDWATHLGKGTTLLVNASTWGLLLTGKVVSQGQPWMQRPASLIDRLTTRMGEPVIRVAVARAMKILGGEFVLGETIKSAISRGRKAFRRDQIYSFDMLGEGARTEADAIRYLHSYSEAIAGVAGMQEGGSVTGRSGVSVKLSAIYSRYEFANRDQVLKIVVARLSQLVEEARAANVKLTVDAEEADRLSLSLEVFERVARAIDLSGWSGFGLAIQAYGKRARRVINWTASLAHELNCEFMVRLVKGAYWDSEIKHAQELGLSDFPVFTRKSTTDLSYLVCAQDMLDNSDVLFCQFATHNAHTIAAVMYLGAGQTSRFEFQRLHGMGEGIYDVASSHYDNFPPVRIYAPVGGHKDLLAYLVRRLLENGANSSFVNRFMDAKVPANDIVRDPVSVTRRLTEIAHPQILKSESLFGMSRSNSKGLDLTDPETFKHLTPIIDGIYNETFEVQSVSSLKNAHSEQKTIIRNPSDTNDILGTAAAADPGGLNGLFEVAKKAQPQWDKIGGVARAVILNKAADLIEERTERFMGILLREAGKIHDDALAEVREAVDFLRFYAAQASAEFEVGADLPGPTGEANTLHLCGRGVFVCISPWNFPLAIFIGQIGAALAAGNSVIAKPAEQTPIVAVEATRLLIEAGVPKEVISTILGGGDIGAAITNHPDVAGVAFTGSTATAKLINLTLAQKDGPIIPMIAETGGQNVMFVDSTALLEQVADDVVSSAFISAGQRCSALRVLYLQTDIADNALQMIRGAMDMLEVGNPRHLSTDVGPIIDEKAADLLNDHIRNMRAQGFKFHEKNVCEATQNGYFVQPTLFEINSISDLKKENFGPILHVVRYEASNLDATLDEAFSTGFGLTMGVHTRMDQRWQKIFRRAPVGNTYVNRNMTGAVVGSQPFGGQGLSGTGFKAGGPRYIYRFATEKTLTVNTMASGGNTELLTLE